MAQGRPGETAAELPGGRPVAAGRCCKLKCPGERPRWAVVAGTGAEAAQAAECKAEDDKGATELTCCLTKNVHWLLLGSARDGPPTALGDDSCTLLRTQSDCTGTMPLTRMSLLTCIPDQQSAQDEKQAKGRQAKAYQAKARAKKGLRCQARHQQRAECQSCWLLSFFVF